MFCGRLNYLVLIKFSLASKKLYVFLLNINLRVGPEMN